jgi:hypothetical protein
MAFHTSLSDIFSLFLWIGTYKYIDDNIRLFVVLSSFLLTPKITQPFSLVGHDIYHCRTAAAM